MTRRRKEVAGWASLLVLAAIGLGWLGGHARRWRPVLTGAQTAAVQDTPVMAPLLETTPTPVYVGEAITTAAAAIDMTLGRFPAGFTPGPAEARLVSRLTYYRDFLGDDLSEFAPPSELPPHEPVWLVGIPSEGLTVGDTIDVPALGTGIIDDSQPADGMFYAWDARTGAPEGSGAMFDGTLTSLRTLSGLPNEDIPIVRPTLEIPGSQAPES
jgi:hypothetical protein